MLEGFSGIEKSKNSDKKYKKYDNDDSDDSKQDGLALLDKLVASGAMKMTEKAKNKIKRIYKQREEKLRKEKDA